MCTVMTCEDKKIVPHMQKVNFHKYKRILLCLSYVPSPTSINLQNSNKSVHSYNLNLILVSSHDARYGQANFIFYAFCLICRQNIRKTWKGLMINDTLQKVRTINKRKKQPQG
jgi:hypothetical protein